MPKPLLPALPADAPAPTCQQRFHGRWGHLRDTHVRALAWLLDSPGLLDPDAPQWRGQVAVPAALTPAQVAWLERLDQAPQDLHDFLELQPLTRLGRYAERLLAYYLRACGILYAQGVQVRSDSGATAGELDFLLWQGDALIHWEFATKLYLLEPEGAGQSGDYFIGPNLADTLGAKLGKVFSRQLRLPQHPDAQRHLPQAVARSQALIKGWLFYHRHAPAGLQAPGVAAAHCRGFWCEQAELDELTFTHAVVLPRLQWLAPACVAAPQALDRHGLRAALAAHFSRDRMPLLVALLAAPDAHGMMRECSRGFIVSDDWRARAGARRRPGLAG